MEVKILDKKIEISEVGLEGIERLILTIKIGLLTLLEENAISIEELENYIYSPYSAEHLRKLGVNPIIVDLIISGCELEDFDSLMPDKLSEKINTIKTKSIEIYKKINKPNLPTKKWIDVDKAN